MFYNLINSRTSSVKPLIVQIVKSKQIIRLEHAYRMSDNRLSNFGMIFVGYGHIVTYYRDILSIVTMIVLITTGAITLCFEIGGKKPVIDNYDCYVRKSACLNRLWSSRATK